MRHASTKRAERFQIWMVAALALMIFAMPAGAQKKDKKKDVPTTDAGEDLRAAMQTPDPQAIDRAIGEALGYWQLGDAESLHKYYSDNVVIVSGVWEQPIIGWNDFLKAYQEQRAQVSGARLDRTNTLIKVTGNSAWATYQFIYAVQQKDGRTAQFRGHTTLVLIKQADRWLITLDHSSVVDSSLTESNHPMNSVQPRKP
jgi:ketosteroid isomerase-like protein